MHQFEFPSGPSPALRTAAATGWRAASAQRKTGAMIKSSISFHDLTEGDVSRLAQEVAFLVQPGDTLALEGDLGAGKSTFARALIRAISGNPALEIPSPTFTLVQAYETPRFEIAHFDLYRLSDPSEIDELGLDAALTRGVAVHRMAVARRRPYPTRAVHIPLR